MFTIVIKGCHIRRRTEIDLLVMAAVRSRASEAKGCRAELSAEGV
jgi:hypothetical protein